MKIQLNQIAELMIALKQRGEDPNDYFEIGVETGTTLVEGQTRLTEFTDLTITEKKQRKGKKGSIISHYLI